MAGRYALYYVPDAESNLYGLGSRLLGRCIYSGRSLPRPPLKGVAEETIIRHTRQASIYGFHATLVAPFETWASEMDLAATAELIARNTRPIKLDKISLSAMDEAWAALIPEDPPEQLSRLEGQGVRAFSRFRLPLTEGDLARRGQLPPRLRDNLIRWGYHLVFDDFKFHLTLADSLPAEGDAFLAALESYLEPALNQPLVIDRLALVYQPSRLEPFLCRKIFKLQDFENEY